MKYTDKIYGSFELSGVIEEVINAPIFQRLKLIHQGGAIFLVNPKINHTRYDHSIGVMLLIKKLGGNLEEQIAGLIHDISHTAFSHLIDYVLENNDEDYHEKRYVEVLEDKELNDIFIKYNIEIDTFFNLDKYPILEYPLPNLSADRIDYTLRDLFQLGKISQKEISWFLEGLYVFEKRIVLKSEAYGRWFLSKYDFLVTNYFGGKENVEINIAMKKIINNCLNEGIIKEKDFFKNDFYLIKKINNNIDLNAEFEKIKKQCLSNTSFKMKKRVIDPEILVNKKVISLSEMN